MISVIVPVGNDCEVATLQRAIDSVPNTPDCELITVTDRDGKGPSWARNRGIERATGSHILFLDADDELLFIPHADAELVIGDYIIAGRDRRYLYDRSKYLYAPQVVADFLACPYGYTSMTYVWNKVFCTNIIRDNGICFDEEMRNHEDMLFNIDYLRCADDVFYVHAHSYLYHPKDKPPQDREAFDKVCRSAADYLVERAMLYKYGP